MIVYALAHPDTREIRYVGETVRSAKERLGQHLRSAAEKTTPPVNAWLRGLGRPPAIIELEATETKDQMHCAEVYWIEQFRAMGASLLNIAPGGSTRKGYRHSAETRARWREFRRGENGSNYGKRRTPEQVAAMAERTREWHAQNDHPMAGKRHSASALVKISRARKGRSVATPASRAAASEFCRNRWAVDPNYRAKMSRPGLSNPRARTVIVDGKPYSISEIISVFGVSQGTATSRANEFEKAGLPLTAADIQKNRRWAR